MHVTKRGFLSLLLLLYVRLYTAAQHIHLYTCKGAALAAVEGSLRLDSSFNAAATACILLSLSYSRNAKDENKEESECAAITADYIAMIGQHQQYIFRLQAPF